MSNFAFIASASLRELIERDNAEIQRCVSAKAHKSTLILCGSVVEASLVDFLLRFPTAGQSNLQVYRMTLSDLVEEVQVRGGVSAKTKSLCDVLRGYRNLIHPGVEVRLGESFDEDTASVAVGLLNIIGKELSGAHGRLAGHRAADALQTLIDDVTSEARSDLILGSMDEAERRKLFNAITSFLLDQVSDGPWTETYSRLLRVQRKLCGSLPSDFVHDAVRAFGKTLLHENPRRILVGIACFDGALRALSVQEQTACVGLVIDAVKRGDDGLLTLGDDAIGFDMLSALIDDGYLPQLKELAHELAFRSRYLGVELGELQLKIFGRLTGHLSGPAQIEVEKEAEEMGSETVKKYVAVPF